MELKKQTPIILSLIHIYKVSTIHEDRQRRGLVLPFTVAENAVLEKYRTPEFGAHGVLDRAKMHEFTEQLIHDYDVRPADCADHTAAGLSGGNQQKVIIGREISNNPDVLIAVQPTRGLDVGAIEYVHKTLVAERDRGTAILLISLELDEVMSCLLYTSMSSAVPARSAKAG